MRSGSTTEFSISVRWLHCLYQRGRATPYGDIDLVQHCFIWWHQTITRINVDLLFMGFSGSYLRIISQNVLKRSVRKITFKNIFVKLLSCHSGNNGLEPFPMQYWQYMHASIHSKFFLSCNPIYNTCAKYYGYYLQITGGNYWYRCNAYVTLSTTGLQLHGILFP